MSLKGQTVDVLSNMAAAGPWRAAFEKALVSLSHRRPSSKTLVSVCRHFGSKLIDREGTGFSRVAVFDTGGMMLCGGDSSLARLSLLYYFVGTINGQHEDEQGVAHLFKRVVETGDVFFDLGANFGFYSCYVLPMCGKSGAVHSFEPNIALIPHLRRLSELNACHGRIHVNPVAVGRETGAVLPLYGSDRIGCSSLYRHAWLSHESPINVPVISVDSYIREKGIDRVDVVKIDVEGAELDALEGMQETLCVRPPRLIVCELTLMNAYDTVRAPDRGPVRASSAADPRLVSDFLAARGYQLYRIADDGRLGRWPFPDMVVHDEFKLVNVAFVRPALKDLRPELFTAA